MGTVNTSHDEPLEDVRQRTRMLLGDVVTDALDRAGLADVIRRHWPNCGCAARRARLNSLHLWLTGRPARVD